MQAELNFKNLGEIDAYAKEIIQHIEAIMELQNKIRHVDPRPQITIGEDGEDAEAASGN